MRLRETLVVLVIAALLLTGCTKDALKNEESSKETPTVGIGLDNGQGQGSKDETEKETNKDQASESVKEDDIKETKEPDYSADLSVKPNEVGEVMVLMYHGIDTPEATWVRTPDNFRKDLEILYQKGYRPIRLVDFVNNNINVGAGYTPVILTFDDGNLNNFNIIERDGQRVIDPDCAVGIMEEFNKKYPDFNVTATFYINANPFRQPEQAEYKLNFLVENGYDIGNHTMYHHDLSKVSDSSQIQKHLGSLANVMEGYLENKEYRINTLALPFGGKPDQSLYRYLESGEYEGKEYENIAVLNVGWRPSVSVSHKDFNHLQIHRVRASEMNVDGVGMHDWIANFDKNPGLRYISDGNPNTVSVPEHLKERVDTSRLGDRKLIIYNKEGEIINQ